MPVRTTLMVDTIDKRRQSSLSKYYLQEIDRSSIESIEKSEIAVDDKIKMISSGLVRRKKNKSTTYEWIYLKIKQSVLYIYENEAM